MFLSVNKRKYYVQAKKEGGKKDTGSGGWLSGWFSWGSKPEQPAQEQKSYSEHLTIRTFSHNFLFNAIFVQLFASRKCLSDHSTHAVIFQLSNMVNNRNV